MKTLTFLLFLNLSLILSSQASELSRGIFKNKYDSGVEIEAIETKFIKSNHRLTRCGKNYLCLIDNKPFWGADGKIPQTLLEKLVFKNKKTIVQLDTSGMFNPKLEGNLNNSITITHYFGDTYIVRGRFSDGAGAYFAEWVVTKQGSIRVLLGNSELLYESFSAIFPNK